MATTMVPTLVATGCSSVSTSHARRKMVVVPAQLGSSFLPGCSMAIGYSSTASKRRRRPLTVVGLFGLGMPELVVIAGVAALVFGPKKLPEIGKSLGKTVKSFQQAASEFQAEVKTGVEDESSSSSPTVNSKSENTAITQKENADV